MATIGRQSAIANIVWPFHAHWSGFPAWMAWLVVHIYFLIGFRNRIMVLMQWAWTYLTFTRGARLITGSMVLPGWAELSATSLEASSNASSELQISELEISRESYKE
jgi:NADH dehydrogenase